MNESRELPPLEIVAEWIAAVRETDVLVQEKPE